MRHTPGPWRVERFKHSMDCRIQPATGMAPGGSLADVYGNDANARLIAAAPDLLDIAKAIRILDRAVDLFAGNDAIGERLRAVIANAEGDA